LTPKDLPQSQQRLINELRDNAGFAAIATLLRQDGDLQPMRKLDRKSLSVDSIAINFAYNSGFAEGIAHVLDYLQGEPADGGN
tara:strand:+ start:77 stop:325 length:249 start_codon:yes stop_codon:yes gene_type:complete